MKLKEMLTAGAIGLSTLNGCGDSPDVECGSGIHNIQVSTWQQVWDYCAAQAQLGRLSNEESYVMCPATCTDAPTGCERKYTCAQVWSRENVDGNQLDLKTLNGCIGNGAAVCNEKVED